MANFDLIGHVCSFLSLATSTPTAIAVFLYWTVSISQGQGWYLMIFVISGSKYHAWIFLSRWLNRCLLNEWIIKWLFLLVLTLIAQIRCDHLKAGHCSSTLVTPSMCQSQNQALGKLLGTPYIKDPICITLSLRSKHFWTVSLTSSKPSCFPN